MTPREANKLLFERYIEILRDNNFDGPDKANSEHLIWMCENVDCENWPIDKISRWLGFIQGILIYNNILTVDDERNFTRPLFTQS